MHYVHLYKGFVLSAAHRLRIVTNKYNKLTFKLILMAYVQMSKNYTVHANKAFIN